MITASGTADSSGDDKHWGPKDASWRSSVEGGRETNMKVFSRIRSLLAGRYGIRVASPRPVVLEHPLTRRDPTRGISITPLTQLYPTRTGF